MSPPNEQALDFSEIATRIEAQHPVFVGRSGSFKTIGTYLNNRRKSEVLIATGAFGSGKTSVLNEAEQLFNNQFWIPPEGWQFDCIPIEVSGITAVEGFANVLWRSMLGKVKEPPDAELPGTLRSGISFGAYNIFEEHIRRFTARHPNHLFVIIIDDFDKLLRQLPQEYDKTLGLIKFIMQRDFSSLCFRFLLAMPMEYQPFMASAIPYRELLTLLSMAEYSEMCQKLAAPHEIPREIVEWLYTYTSGYPMFGYLALRSLCDYLAQTRKTQWPPRCDFVSAEKEIMKRVCVENDMESWFASLADPRQQKALVLLAAHNNAIPEKELLAFLANKKPSAITEVKLKATDETEPQAKPPPPEEKAVDHLVKYHYLERISYPLDPGDKEQNIVTDVRAHIRFCHDWLRSWRQFLTLCGDYGISKSGTWRSTNTKGRTKEMTTERISEGDVPLQSHLPSPRVIIEIYRDSEDEVDGQVYVDKVPKKLGGDRLMLMLFFAKNAGLTVTYSELKSILKKDYVNQVHLEIRRLREELGLCDIHSILNNVRSRGYKLDPERVELVNKPRQLQPVTTKGK